MTLTAMLSHSKSLYYGLMNSNNNKKNSNNNKKVDGHISVFESSLSSNFQIKLGSVNPTLLSLIPDCI